MTTALPPHIQHSTSTISPRAALETLATFLEAATHTAAYRPDSTLTEHGPVSFSTAGNPNLVLHHLNRIKLGLEGVRVGPAPIETEEGATAVEETGPKKRKRDEQAGETTRRERAARQDVPVLPGVAVTNGEDDDDAEPTLQATEKRGGEWEDKDEYELAQDDEEVDMNNDRDPAGGLAQPADSQEAADMMEVAETQPGMEVPLPLHSSEKTMEKSVVDKQERRRLKKLKQQQEKREAEGEGKARRRKK